MIDIEEEDLLTIKEARKRIPGRPSMSTNRSYFLRLVSLPWTPR